MIFEQACGGGLRMTYASCNSDRENLVSGAQLSSSGHNKPMAWRRCSYLEETTPNPDLRRAIKAWAPNSTPAIFNDGSTSSNSADEGYIRRACAEAYLVDCVVCLSGQIDYSTQIPVCLCFLAKDKSGVGVSPASSKPSRWDGWITFCDHRKQTLFTNARKRGSRAYHELPTAVVRGRRQERFFISRKPSFINFSKN